MALNWEKHNTFHELCQCQNLYVFVSNRINQVSSASEFILFCQYLNLFAFVRNRTYSTQINIQFKTQCNQISSTHNYKHNHTVKQCWTAWPLNMGLTRCPQNIITNYQPTLHNIPEDQRPHLERGGAWNRMQLYSCIGQRSYWTVSYKCTTGCPSITQHLLSSVCNKMYATLSLTEFI